MKSIRKYFVSRYAPRWLILQIDIFLSAASLLASYFLRFNFDLSKVFENRLEWVLPAYLFVRVFFFRIFRIYRGITRYTGVHDAVRLFLSIALGSGLLWVTSFIDTEFFRTRQLLPLSVVIIDFFTTLVLLTSFRIGVKIIFNEFNQRQTSVKQNVIIFGAGRSGLITKRTIDQDGNSGNRVVAFFDDNTSVHGKIIEGVPIPDYSDEKFQNLIEKFEAKELIISVQDMPAQRKQNIVDLCLQAKIGVKIIPPANKWINGELSLSQIKKVRIEDLLERDPIQIDNELIAKDVKDSVVLVSGAAGSIGSELVRQLLKFFPEKVILVDQAETPLAELKLELVEKYKYQKFEFIMADVRDRSRLKSIFEKEAPQVVFHVAAYKHVPMMEENPSEAILTNVMGSKNMADMSAEHEVKKFVMISTDKAVNPTNVMGASKRIAEIYIQSLHYHLSEQKAKTKYITTRFGNVLGSNGSVIPRFRQQIEKGGPVTVTHPEITRFFMTIPEACQLILEAGTMGEGGEIFIFDMGKDVKIVDLAKKMIRLSGLQPDKIKIEFTGLRAGEKIKEELLNDKENTLPTHHEKIMIARVRKYAFGEVEVNINELIERAKSLDQMATVNLMKKIVPEFISNNSQYSVLDKKSATPAPLV